MFCIYCGAENPEDTVFCKQCGKRQPTAASIPATARAMAPGFPFPEPSQESRQSPAETRPLEPEIPSTLTSALAGQSISQSVAPLASLASSQTVQQNVGFLIATAGGALALFAFFFLPYLSLGFSGPLTGSQLASMNSGLLWLEPLIAAAVIGIAVYQIARSQGHEIDKQAAWRLAIALMILAGITLLALFIKYTIDTQPPIQLPSGSSGPPLASFYSSGIWVYFLGMLAVFVGGIVQVRSLSLKK